MRGPERLGSVVLVAIAAHDLRLRLCRAFLARDLSCSACEADSGSAALEVFLRYRPEGVILDAGFEDFNGFDLLLRMKQVRPECPVVLMVGSADPFVWEAGRRLGASELCQKSEETGRIVAVTIRLLRSARPWSAHVEGERR